MAMGTNGRAAAPRRRTDQAGTTTRRRPTGSAGQKLDQNTIDRFPTNVVKKGAPEENCCICMDEIRAGSVCRRLPCFHTFHQEYPPPSNHNNNNNDNTEFITLWLIDACRR